jgi:hypothetical protein
MGICAHLQSGLWLVEFQLGVNVAHKSKPEPMVETLLGVGLDGTDSHRRITEADDVLLIGGSAETHERMQETVIKVGEVLHRRGKRLCDTTPRELADLILDAEK